MFDVKSARARVYSCKGEKEYILRHLRVMDCFSDRYLRKQEMEVLAEVVRLGGEINQDTRQVVMSTFGFSSNNLSNYVRELAKMGWLEPVKGTTKYKVAARAIPGKGYQQYAVQLNLAV